jgi:hypothetical protein
VAVCPRQHHPNAPASVPPFLCGRCHGGGQASLWSHLKRSLGNLVVQGIDDLAAIVKNRLKRIQYRPELTDAFFEQTGLSLRVGNSLIPAFQDL